MSLAYEAGRWVGRRLTSASSRWREAREAFEQGLRRGYSKSRLEELYGRLELPIDADLEQVEQAWKRLVRLYHPDRFANDPDRLERATRVVAALNDARAELKRYLASR